MKVTKESINDKNLLTHEGICHKLSENSSKTKRLILHPWNFGTT